MTSQRIGKILGIPLFIDPSWFIILAFITFLDGQTWFLRYNHWGVWAWVAGLVTALLLFTSVLLHELGHSLVAISQGIRVNSITLFLFGGVASIESESKTPEQALQVALAGPAVSFALFGLLSGLGLVVPGENPVAVLSHQVAHINLVLAIFNLIPGLPLDGGQALKAIVWKITQNRFTGVHWAAATGKILGWGAMLLGGLSILYGDGSLEGVWIIMLGWFVIQNANTYDRMTSIQETLLRLKAQDAMTRHYRVVEATLSLRQFADHYLLEEHHPVAYFAASDGRYRGLISLDRWRSVERSLWERRSIQDIVIPLDQLPSVKENAPLGLVINHLQQHHLGFITVLSPAGTVSGVIDRSDVVRCLNTVLNLNLTDADLNRIKEEGKYPPGLPLALFAQSITADLESLQESRPS